MNKFDRPVQALALLAGTMAAASLWTWGAGVSDLLSFAAQPIPTAPSTALVLGLASVALFYLVRHPGQRLATRLGYLVCALLAVAGILACLRHWFPWGWTLERWLSHTSQKTNGIPIGRMSPATGAMLGVIAVAFLLRLVPQRDRVVLRRSAAVSAVMVTLAGAGVGVSYGLAKPWLYGTETVPVALWTALILIVLGLSLVLNSCGRPDPASLAVPVVGARRPVGWAIVLFRAVPFIIGILGAIHLRDEQAEMRDHARDLLKAVADLKAGQIATWRQHCLGKAKALAEVESLGEQAARFLADRSSASSRAALLHQLELAKAGDRFDLAALCDTNGTPWLAAPASPEVSEPMEPESARAALETGTAVMSELHRGGDTAKPHMSVIVPLFAGATGGPAGFAKSPSPGKRIPVAILTLRVDPRQYLYRLIESWPTPSETAETVLVRREGTEVVFLNNLRGRPDSALTLRLPLGRSSSAPAVAAALGRTDRVEGQDYRGVRVVAAVRPVPDSPWSVICKEDQAECYAAMHDRAWETAALTILLAGAFGLVAWQARRLGEASFAQRELAAERQRLVLAQRLEHLMRSANDAILLTDQDGKILEVNDRAREVYGYSEAEFRRLGLEHLSPVGARAEFARAAGERQERRQAVYETTHQRKDGSVLTVEVSSSFVALDGASQHLCIVRDITARKAQEREIARLTRLYETLSQINQSIVRTQSREQLFEDVCRIAAEHAPFKLVWVGWLDPQTRRVWAAARAGESKGYLEQIEIYADDRPEGQGPLGRCICEGRSCIRNDFLGDPTTAPWHEHAARFGLRAAAAIPIRQGGSVCGAVVVYAGETDVFRDREIALLEEMADDISFALENLEREASRREAERRVADTLAYNQILLQTSPIGIITYRATGEVVSANPAAARVTGGTMEQLAAQNFRQLESWKRSGLLEAAEAALASRMEQHLDTHFVTSFGKEAWLACQLQPFMHEGQPHLLGLFTDIRERLKAEEERKLLEAQLRQAQKMEAIGQLAGGVAHDFNNILAVTMLHLGMLQEKEGLDAETLEALSELEAQAKRAASLTRQLLLFGRRSVMQPRTLDLNEVIENLLKMLRRLIGEHIELHWQGQGGLPPLKADPGMLEQVVMNLVVNARDALQQGGQITLSTETVRFDAEQAKADPHRRPGSFVCLAIADTGCGMEEETLKRIFEPFFTTKAAGKGTGLGLATAYGIVRQHEGWITVESQAGRGSTFRVYLPVSDAPAPDAERRPEQERPRGGPETILLVEDEGAMRIATAKFLRNSGYQVLEAESGRRAIEVWQRQSSPVDLLLTDMVMPGGMSGLQLAEQLRGIQPGLRVILTSGYSAELTHQPGSLVQGIKYLPKPCPPLELAATIRRALDGANS